MKILAMVYPGMTLLELVGPVLGPGRPDLADAQTLAAARAAMQQAMTGVPA